MHVHAGGMLGTWFRYKYPHVIDGVIAGSAPIWNFEGEVWQDYSFLQLAA